MGTVDDKPKIEAHRDEIHRKLYSKLHFFGTTATPERYLDGVRIRVRVFDAALKLTEYKPVYVYVLPWSRGVSVFTTELETAGVYDWRNCELRYRGLQRPFYCDRGKAGSWTISVDDIANAALQIVEKLNALSRARQTRHRKQHWPQYMWHTVGRLTAEHKLEPVA